MFTWCWGIFASILAAMTNAAAPSPNHLIELPSEVIQARELVEARRPTTQPLQYEAKFEYVTHAKKMYERRPVDGGSRTELVETGIKTFDPPAVTRGTLRVQQTGEDWTIEILPAEVAAEHKDSQFGHHVTLWRSGGVIGEISHTKGYAVIDDYGATLTPLPAQLRVPHMIFGYHLARDWRVALASLRQESQQRALDAGLSINSARPSESEILISERFTVPGSLTRGGTLTVERKTAYSRIAGKWVPVSVIAGTLRHTVTLEWAPETIVDASIPFFPRSVTFAQHMPTETGHDPPTVVMSEDSYYIDPASVQFGPNYAGDVEIPVGVPITYVPPPAQMQLEAQMGQTATPSVDTADPVWLLIAGTAVLAAVIIAAFMAIWIHASGRPKGGAGG